MKTILAITCQMAMSICAFSFEIALSPEGDSIPNKTFHVSKTEEK